MRYFVKKFFSMAATLFLVSFLVFAAFEVIPGDVAVSMLGTNATESTVAALREELGLNRPFLTRFFEWIGSCLSGDFGESYSYHMPVWEMISEKIPITMTMALMSFLITVAVSIPLGVYLAKHAGSKVDKGMYMTNQVVMAVPSFFMGIIFTYFFGLVLRWFVPGGFVPYDKSMTGFLGYLIFPSIAIALPKIAMTVKLLRSSILTESKKDYVRTAYSRGNNTTEVLYRHVLKNAMIPVITFLGMTFTDMVAGSIVVEQVFNIPGLGRILLTSISNRDYPVVEIIILFIALLIMVVNFAVDILYRYLDPRIREQQSGRKESGKEEK